MFEFISFDTIKGGNLAISICVLFSNKLRRGYLLKKSINPHGISITIFTFFDK